MSSLSISSCNWMRSIFRDEMKLISSFDRFTKERFLGALGSSGVYLTLLILALLFGFGDICWPYCCLGLKPCMVAENCLCYIIDFESEILVGIFVNPEYEFIVLKIQFIKFRFLIGPE